MSSFTFDDGYKSWVTRAVPVLRILGLPAIFFVSSGFVGLRHEEEIEFVRLNLCQTQDNQRISGSLTSAEVKMIANGRVCRGGAYSELPQSGETRGQSELNCNTKSQKIRRGWKRSLAETSNILRTHPGQLLTV